MVKKRKRKKEKKLKYKPFKIPQPKVREDGSYESGPSFSKGQIRRKAVALIRRKTITYDMAEMIVRRTIARLKQQKYHIPVGIIIWPRYYVGTYKVTFTSKKVKVGRTHIQIYRAERCDCYAGLNGHRCWHQDYCDYHMDGFSIVPRQYGAYSKSFIKRMRRMKGVKNA